MAPSSAPIRTDRLDKAESSGYTIAGLLRLPQSVTDDGNWWMITLSDLTFLLLGFLVLWYVMDNEAHAPVPVAQPASAGQQGTAASSREGDLRHPEWNALATEMQDIVNDLKLSHAVDVETSPGEVLISLTEGVPFDSGKADLRPEALPFLEKVAALVLKRPELLLAISGHTDNRPIATTAFPSNWELSAARASRVARLLIDRGILPDRVSVQGYASQRPKLADSDRKHRQVNRRVEIRLYLDSKSRRASE